MRVGLPVWNSRISPVFDTSERLLLVDLDGGKEVARSEVVIAEPFPPRNVERLVALGLEVLVCGGISRPLAQLVQGRGIQLIPWVSGNVDEVLAAYLADNLSSAQFFMPGCGGRGRRRGRGRYRGRQWAGL